MGAMFSRGQERLVFAVIALFIMMRRSKQKTIEDSKTAAPAAPAGAAPSGTGAAAHPCPFLAYEAMQDKVSNKPQTELNLQILYQPNYLGSDYAADFKNLNLATVKQDLAKVLKTSQDWWPADYGHYGPLMCRLAWHSAGTYRIYDGRGGANAGNQRFVPHMAWPDNGNLDKARRLLWPIKQGCGKSLSWGDLMILAGNVGMEDMGFKTFGFGGGRVDIWARETDAFWGVHESFKGLASAPEKLESPLAAPNMELIYVNPEGPDAIPDPLMAAKHIRDSFGRMAMNDSETVALIAGGHTFGKAHGAGPGENVGPDPRGAEVEDQGFGWKSTFGTGKGKDAITSGLEGAWTANPTKWDHGYFENLFKFEWELYKSPAGAQQWRPKAGAGVDLVPDAHVSGKTTHPIMFTTDLALIKDPEYLKISKRFKEQPAEFADAFARAWYKLCHRDMGPVQRLLGAEVAAEQIWQDPVPDGKAISSADLTALKTEIGSSGLSIDKLVRVAWASASTFRKTDFRGGANGARIRLAPQKGWATNADAAEVIGKLEAISKGRASVADMIVLGGCVAVEMAAKKGGVEVEVPFRSGRGDATAEKTDAESFNVLKPDKDAFLNQSAANPYMMVDHAHKLGLNTPEMTCLIAGLRVLGGNCAEAGDVGVLTSNPQALTNDYFVNLTDMSTTWVKAGALYEGKDRATGARKWRASLCDMTLGSNAELRAVCEHYAMKDSKKQFVQDFANAWSKVMHADSYGRF